MKRIKAVRKDPNFSPAYSGLANAYLYLVFFGQGRISAEEGIAKAREDVKKALELDPGNAEAYDVLGQLKWHADLDWNAADQAFNQSLTLAPSYSCALEDRALFLAFMGRSAEALAEIEKSRQVDPSAIDTELAVYFQLRDGIAWSKPDSGRLPLIRLNGRCTLTSARASKARGSCRRRLPSIRKPSTYRVATPTPLLLLDMPTLALEIR